MESVKMWVMSIAVGAIAGAVALALSPSDSLGKTVRTTDGRVIIEITIMPKIPTVLLTRTRLPIIPL